ncbi:hypothetical protein CEXT_265331 [Caerostris extrusa]|uniref:Uncharacterized protein n=1 Tax=Caerostris extrusa TaxID=172846 RepID=A0AAV4X555_CAEEX|nr:hypothetical protein CEXT_265331 [Caerostris extrusa]
MKTSKNKRRGLAQFMVTYAACYRVHGSAGLRTTDFDPGSGILTSRPRCLKYWWATTVPTHPRGSRGQTREIRISLSLSPKRKKNGKKKDSKAT